MLDIISDASGRSLPLPGQQDVQEVFGEAAAATQGDAHREAAEAHLPL